MMLSSTQLFIAGVINQSTARLAAFDKSNTLCYHGQHHAHGRQRRHRRSFSAAAANYAESALVWASSPPAVAAITTPLNVLFTALKVGPALQFRHYKLLRHQQCGNIAPATHIAMACA